MPREERISRQWPPSEIAMENGNTMIPPVARTWTGQHGPGGSAMQFQLYKLQQLCLEFKTILSLYCNLVFLTVRRENYYWQASYGSGATPRRVEIFSLPGIWSDLEQSICRSEEPIKKTFTAHFRLIHISGREADGWSIIQSPWPSPVQPAARSLASLCPAVCNSSPLSG